MLGIVFCFGAAVIVMWGISDRRARKRPLLGRSCGGREWRRAFPEAGKGEIREFLRVFTDGFGFRRRHGLAFRPTDRVMRVYRTINPSRWSVDAMELEEFARLLEGRYGFVLEGVLSEELTLGEVFGRAKRQRSA